MKEVVLLSLRSEQNVLIGQGNAHCNENLHVTICNVNSGKTSRPEEKNDVSPV